MVSWFTYHSMTQHFTPFSGMTQLFTPFFIMTQHFTPFSSWLSTSLLFRHDSALHSFFFIMTQHATPFSQLSNTPSGFLPLSERTLDSFNGVLSTDDQDFVRTLFSPLLDLLTPSDFFVALPNCFSRWLPWFSYPASSKSLSSSHPHWCLWVPCGHASECEPIPHHGLEFHCSNDSQCREPSQVSIDHLHLFLEKHQSESLHGFKLIFYVEF